jgi:RimJ/RimL family protein N-acetyltransferase
VLETERLRLRWLCDRDAPFVLELLNDPDFRRFIGDKGARSLDDARAYIEKGPVVSYATHGFGLYLVESRAEATPMGICGLIRREQFTDVDVGFAFLPAFRSRGIAFEAALGTLEHAARDLGLGRIIAMVSPDNAASIRLIERLGLRYEGSREFEPGKPVVALYGRELATLFPGPPDPPPTRAER